MISATSSLRPGIADSLLIPNKLRDGDLAQLKVRDGAASSFQKTHDQFLEYLETDTPRDTLRKITENGLSGYIAWKIDQLKAQITKQVMGEMGVTLEALNGMEAGKRAELEEKIMREVQRRLELMIKEGIKENSDQQGGTDAAMPGADTGQAAPADPLVNRLPPLMAQESQNAKSLEQTVGGALAGLFTEGGFAPTPPLTLSIDDRGQIRLAGDRPDLADIEAALATDATTTDALRLLGAVAAGTAMLEDAQDDPVATAAAAEDQQTAYARMLAGRSPRETVLRFDGNRIELVATRRIDRPAA